MNIRYPIYEGVYRILTTFGAVSFLFRGLYCPCLTVEAAASGCEFVSMRYVH